MSLIYITYTFIITCISRLTYNINKEIYLISSILIGIPTLYNWKELEIYYKTDGISDILILLTIYLIPISIISNWNNIKNNLYYELIINTGIILILNLMCQDMLTFYIYFEASLCPLFIIISLYGSRNKEKASNNILIYTILSSLFMLLSIIIYYIILENTEYQSTSLLVLSIDLQCILYLGIIIAILVKTPLLPFHTWLPIVHSESPLGGSILLAGVILKLAIYAIIRIILPSLPDASILYSPIIIILSIFTIIYVSIITIKQTDLKVIIAYSSVSHMAICILGILSNSITGFVGSLTLSIAHGLVSPALFIIVGGILYDRYHNRLIYYYQGLINYMPLLTFYLMILSFCNIGIPLSLNFIGELLALSGIIDKSPLLGFIASLSVLLSACYQLKLTTKLVGGIKSPYIKLTSDCTFRETILMLSLILPILLLGILPNFLLDLLWELPNLLYLLLP